MVWAGSLQGLNGLEDVAIHIRMWMGPVREPPDFSAADYGQPAVTLTSLTPLPHLTSNSALVPWLNQTLIIVC